MGDTGTISGSLLITGGTGTLGRAIIRRAAQEHWSCRFTVLSRDPVKQMELQREFPDTDLRFVMGDVRDYSVLYQTAVGHDWIIHAAANKHIPQAEENVQYTIDVNILGSQNVAMAAANAGVKRVIGISTDKVCYPINVYGHTKALMERIFLEYNAVSKTEFALCRYGNVFGSSGSVVDLWLRQIDEGRLPTITDPEMTRFWLSEDDAVDIVIKTFSAPVGSITVPLAPALSMGTLLEFVTKEGQEFETIGRRPGEKKHERLVMAEESVDIYLSHPGGSYIVIVPGSRSGHVFDNYLADGYTSDEPVRWMSRDEVHKMAGAL